MTDRPSAPGRRPYRLQRRAERETATRRAILEAAVALHQDLGPSATTVSLLARHAGVSRPTVYAHFPDDRNLQEAVAAHCRAAHPPPDPATWSGIEDVWQRLPVALTAILAHWAETSPLAAPSLRDAAADPERFGRVAFASFMDVSREALLTGWPFRGPNHRRRMTAVIHHAVDFGTWASLVRDGGMTHGDAITTLIAAIRSADVRPSTGRM